MSEGLLQAEAVEHFADENGHGNHELIDYYDGCHGNSGKYLCLAILTNNEGCQFSRSTTCLGRMCYDYVRLDNLSDISAYRNHNVQQCKTQIP